MVRHPAGQLEGPGRETHDQGTAAEEGQGEGGHEEGQEGGRDPVGQHPSESETMFVVI